MGKSLIDEPAHPVKTQYKSVESVFGMIEKNPQPDVGKTVSLQGEAGRFTVGSTMRHVVVMTATGSVGLMAIFAVDFLSLFYISLLKNEQITAGVGYATTVLFFAISVNVGLMIAASALVARALGARDRARARRVASSAAVWLAGIATVVSCIMLALLPTILDLLGAEGLSRKTASEFLWITLPANFMMALGMAFSGILRSVGDAKRAMLVTLLGGVATAMLDPLLIFGFGLGANGAALATVMSRVVFCAVGWYGVVHIHDLMTRPSLEDARKDGKALMGIAAPAVMTNVASPIAAGFMLSIVRQFGHEAVAANTIIDRLIPLAFGVIFALSASVGPILAQNLGAKRHDRVRQALRDALIFACLYSLFAWLVLAFGRNAISGLFGASEKTAAYVSFFCLVGTAAWVFLAGLFVANAAFNNLGFPLYSTLFNWGRATLGTMPFAYFGARFWGYEGAVGLVIIGWALFGISSIIVAFKAIARLERQSTSPS